MKTDIVYGTQGEKAGYGQYVKIFMLDEDNHLGIDWTNDGRSVVFHFLIKDKDDYEDFKNELVSVLDCCDNINIAYNTLNSYLDSPYIYDFLDEYPE
jgi:hypothetical protein